MENKKIRILIIIAGFRFGVSGGVASVLYNYCSHMDINKFQFDYLALGYQGFEPYRDELEKNGGHLYCANVTTHGWKRLIQSVTRIYRFIKKKPKYDIVHVNSGAIRQVLMMALAARLAGCRAVIAHSHSAMKVSAIRKKINYILSHLFYLCTDRYIACSEMAAKSMFPHGIINKKKWLFLPNAIEVSKFAFNLNTREKIREEFEIKDDELVLGHVGRFNEPKNHSFLIDIFNEVLKTECCARLLLVGTGDLMDTVRKKAEGLGILDRIIFTGQRKNVNELLQAMDIFVFPSIYEGLGMSVIEAQAAGVYTVASECIPIKETAVTDIIRYLPIDDPNMWAEVVLEMAKKGRFSDKTQEVSDSGYDIYKGVELLEEIYELMMQG